MVARAARPTSAPRRPAHGGRITSVRPASPASSLGLLPGDVLLAMDGLVPRDLIDVEYALAEMPINLTVQRGDETITVRLDAEPGIDLGVEFADAVFAGIRECNNHCEFCFVRALPAGLRPSLYVFDDDYRYSYLFGNFLTLTNLDEADWERIAYQRLSPLWVSVHATDPQVRNRMLINPRAPAIVPQLQRLGEIGVQVHAQVVLCPGINDGLVLKDTIDTLAALWPTVATMAVVPVGLTSSSRVHTIRVNTAAEAARALRLIRAQQRELRPRIGSHFVYASDELYLLAGRSLPAASAYDGFPHLFNGVGLTRYLLAAWAKIRRQAPRRLEAPRRVVWMSARAAAGALRTIAAELSAVENVQVEVREVANSLFGGGIVVSGLLAGRDLLAAVQSVQADVIVLPRAAFGFGQDRTLDEMSLETIVAGTSARVMLGSSARDLLQSIAEPLPAQGLAQPVAVLEAADS